MAETRMCERCGKEFSQGFTDLVNFYCCENCFADEMDYLFGEYGWFVTEEMGRNGGYYMVYDPYEECFDDMGIFWTEWE